MENYIKRLFKVYSLVVLLIIVGCSAVFMKTKSPYVWIFAALSILGIILNMWMIYKANKKK